MPLPANYTSLLNDLNRDVMRSSPQDPLQFCANWFNLRLEEQRRSLLSGRQQPGASDSDGLIAPDVAMQSSEGPLRSPAAAPSSFGSAASSGPFATTNPFGTSSAAAPAPIAQDGEDTADEAAFAPPPAYNLGRRTSVSAESLAPGSGGPDDAPVSKTVIPKSDSQMARIAKATEGNLLFRNLEEDQYRDVLLAMKEVKVDAGITVIEQGAQGDYFYIVESGTLDVYIRPSAASRSASITSTNTEDGPRTDTTSHLGEKKVSYGPSASFGELALLYAQPRAATIVSTSPCILWALDRITFRSILMETNNRRREMYESFIKEVPLFEHLSASERAKISDALELRTYEVGQEIVKQGERGTEFFVIVEGEAEVRKRTLERQEETVGRLGKGDYFGELALLNNAPRAATIVAAASRSAIASGAVDKIRVAALSESAFTRLLGPLAGIMGRHAREHYGPSSLARDGPSAAPALTSTGPSSLAGTHFAEIAPHQVAPTAVEGGSQPGGGTWIGGLGASPFGVPGSSNP
ncbi:unnamed protein product [Parajaminaea phylloscopi]